MSLPKHQNPTKDEFKATAPYNFVPLPEKVIPAPTPLPNHDVYARGYFTGSITCRLTTASPLYIRCGETPQNFSKAKKSQSPEFFTDPAAGAPTIPGSSLRGMLRAMVELVTYGKPQPVSSDRLVYRAVGGTASFEVKYRQRLMQEDGHNTYTPLVQAGYMQKRGPDWVIQPARQIGGVTFARILIKNVPQRLPDRHGCKNARKIWVKLGPYGYKNVREGHVKIKFTDVIEARNRPEAGFTEAVWVGSGRMPGKKFDRVIYLPDTRAGPIPIPAEMIDAYREQISPAQKNLLGNSGVLRPRQPVFYLREEGELVFFGHTLMMRLPYPNSPRDFVPPHLRRDNEIDFAEAMFGYIDLKVKQPARAGRIFVLDARLRPGQKELFLTETPIYPKILSGPKPTSVQHYLTQQLPDPESTGHMTLSHYASPTPHETVIRGHKLYWNNPVQWRNKQAARNAIEDKPFSQKPPDARDKDTQHTQIKPLRAGVDFDFTIRFENLHPLELGALLWALKLGAGDDYRLRLGMGKPLGMGAVKTEAALALTDRRARYAALFTDDGAYWQLGAKKVWASDGQPLNLPDLAAKLSRNFESFIVQHDGNAFSGGRLNQLLALLHWPGPPADKTAYMGLGEFKKRPVLPKPTNVHPHRRAKKQTYPIYFVFRAKIPTRWDGKRQGFGVEMPNGEAGILKWASKKVMSRELAKLKEDTVELVVARFENGLYYLELY